jgi:hypothetical protein
MRVSSIAELQLDPAVAARNAHKLAPFATPQNKKVTKADIAPYRSKTEVRYAQLLEYRRMAGEIIAWEYEPIKLTIGHSCTYTPDFRLMFPDIHQELHEVKGAFIREKAWIKLKVTAAKYPELTFVLAQWKQGEWFYKPVPKE